MEEFSLEADSLKKVFGHRVIFDSISFKLSKQESLSITGPNGSGKTTLVKIMSGLLTPSSGSVVMRSGSQIIKPEDRRDFIGFVAPYIQLYDEFTGHENLSLAAMIRGSRVKNARVEELLERVGLLTRKDDRVGTYSSGMKQRLKFAFALLHDPILLILDEPMSNLDESGIEMVKSIIIQQKKNRPSRCSNKRRFGGCDV